MNLENIWVPCKYIKTWKNNNKNTVGLDKIRYIHKGMELFYLLTIKLWQFPDVIFIIFIFYTFQDCRMFILHAKTKLKTS